MRFPAGPLVFDKHSDAIDWLIKKKLAQTPDGTWARPLCRGSRVRYVLRRVLRQGFPFPSDEMAVYYTVTRTDLVITPTKPSPPEPSEPKMSPDLGRKDDAGKPQYRLLPTRGIACIVDVLTFGAKKYAPNNWKHVPDPVDRYTDAMFRHLYAWLDGEKYDPESGLHHLGHAGCCLLFLMHFELETKA